MRMPRMKRARPGVEVFYFLGERHLWAWETLGVEEEDEDSGTDGSEG
jgi:hypothetical protein